MKIKVKAKDCQLVARVKTASSEKIDERELDRFLRIYLRGFLKPRLLKKNLVEYTGPIGISLYDRLEKPISKRDFLFIIEQIVVAVQKLNANQMALNNFEMSLQHAFINEVTKEIQFLYIPIVGGRANLDIVQFIESIVYSVKPTEDKDMDFVSRFIYYFRAMKVFDVNKVETFVEKEDRSVVNTIRRQNAGQSGFMTDKPQHYYNQQENSKQDEPTGLLANEDEPTGLLNEQDEATGLLSEENEATGLLVDNRDTQDNDDLPTGLLINNNTHYPTLFRTLTSETISVNKPVFRMGKEKSYVDYFVTNNIAVSRSHADIITRGTCYFVKDLNSKNHTFINEQELPAHMEVEMHDGDHLKLGNEEFVFRS